MRIDPKAGITPITLDTSSKAQQAPKGGAAPAGGASVVSLSSAAAAIPAEGTPPPHIAARLDKIRAMLDRGDYPVDLDMLASRIVEDDALRAKR
jgi:anti-sigma28 factor (negative regulator of flagellin synthesis)